MSVFWARSKARMDYEVVFHAYKPAQIYPSFNYKDCVVRLCEHGAIRNQDKLWIGTPKEKYQCQDCKYALAAWVRQRMEKNT